MCVGNVLEGMLGRQRGFSQSWVETYHRSVILGRSITNVPNNIIYRVHPESHSNSCLYRSGSITYRTLQHCTVIGLKNIWALIFDNFNVKCIVACVHIVDKHIW